MNPWLHLIYFSSNSWRSLFDIDRTTVIFISNKWYRFFFFHKEKLYFSVPILSVSESHKNRLFCIYKFLQQNQSILQSGYISAPVKSTAKSHSLWWQREERNSIPPLTASKRNKLLLYMYPCIAPGMAGQAQAALLSKNQSNSYFQI